MANWAVPWSRAVLLFEHFFMLLQLPEEAVIDSIMAGAAGYLLKDTDAERLIEGIEVVARGDSP